MSKLSPDQCDAILRAAKPLGPSAGASFVEEVRLTLADLDEVGDGTVFRVIKTIQRKYFDPPDLYAAHVIPRHWK